MATKLTITVPAPRVSTSKICDENSFLEERNRWLELDKSVKFDEFELPQKTSRSTLRTIYYVLDEGPNSPLAGIEKAFNALDRFSKSSYKNHRTRPRSLWVPNLIIDPIRLHLVIYANRSAKPISNIQLSRYMKKQNLPIPLSAKDPVIQYKPGGSYKLRPTPRRSPKDLPFHEWSVCIMKRNGPVPKPIELDKRKSSTILTSIDLADEIVDSKGRIAFAKNRRSVVFGRNVEVIRQQTISSVPKIQIPPRKIIKIPLAKIPGRK